MNGRSDAVRDRAARIRQAAMRADAVRSIMPLFDTAEAVEAIIERRLHDGSTLPRGCVAQPKGE